MAGEEGGDEMGEGSSASLSASGVWVEDEDGTGSEVDGTDSGVDGTVASRLSTRLKNR